jgi:hypothetical protein
MTGGPFGRAGGKPQRMTVNSLVASFHSADDGGRISRPYVLALFQVRGGAGPFHRDSRLAEGRQIVVVWNVVTEVDA